MEKPNLIVVAGCNGAGKSTYSSTFVENIIPFDFDKHFLANYNALFDSDVRSDMAQNQTIGQFEAAIGRAFEMREDFCYETNFDSNPLYWVNKAKELGYRTELHFYCLEAIEIAKNRVEQRTVNKGHYVPDSTIEYKWKAGYQNLNLHFAAFDLILLIDNTSENTIPQIILEIEKESESSLILRKYRDTLPEYAERRFPGIFSLLSDNIG